MRLCSPLLFLLAVVLSAAPGCYPHQGKPVDAGPQRLLELANDACHRQDPDAADMLLSRLAKRHPDTAQGRHARRLLDDEPSSVARCQHTLQTAETLD